MSDRDRREVRSVTEDPIKTLLQEDVWERDRRWVGRAVGILAVALAAAGAWWLLGRSSEPAEEAAIMTMAQEAPTTTLADLPLGQFVTDPLVYNLPTRAPKGMERCGPVALCGPDEPGRSLTGTFMGELGPSTPIPASGLVRVDGDEPEVAISLVTAGLVFTGSGISYDQLLAIVASVPIADALVFDFIDEPALAEPPTQDFVAMILDVPVTDVVALGRVVRGVETQEMSFSCSIVDSYGGGAAGEVLAMRTEAAAMVDPVTVGEHGILVGRDPNLGRAVAHWVQRGYTWRLNRSGSVDALVDLALRVEDAVADLP